MKENQIGCGYCSKEQSCTKHDPRVNKAKQGCKEFVHWQDDKNYSPRIRCSTFNQSAIPEDIRKKMEMDRKKAEK